MTSGTSTVLTLEGIQSSINLEDVVCPICLEIPHNATLLNCSSYNGGCRALICDTDDSHSNCFGRYKQTYGLPPTTNLYPTTAGTSSQSFQAIPLSCDSSLNCPLCRGKVTGFVVVDEIRAYLNKKKRCCEEKQCAYVGNYMELQQHAKQEHPDSRPSEVDPQRQKDWDNFQRSSETVDVLSTIHSEVPHGVVFGDYFIDYGGVSGDEFDDFPGDDGNWWASCILYHVFDHFRSGRDRQESINEETRRVRPRLSFDGHMDDGSTPSSDMSEDHLSSDNVETGAASSENQGNRRYRRRRFHFSRNPSVG